jgi:hypothetical protein
VCAVFIRFHDVFASLLSNWYVSSVDDHQYYEFLFSVMNCYFIIIYIF